MEALNGLVERITFYNPENGYSVIRLRSDHQKSLGVDQDGLITVTGNLPELSPGMHLRIEGNWVNHPKHGKQFQAQLVEQILPSTITGIRRYLGSGLVKGIGPQLADRIVDHFGMQTLEVIEREPQRLHEVPDIGPKRAEMIAVAWQEQKQIKEIMLFLHSFMVSTNLATKIYKQYGLEAVNIVQDDPYRLATDIRGVGFKTADRIGRELGLPHDHPSRIKAGLSYILNKALDDGHIFLPKHILEDQSIKLLESDKGCVIQSLDDLEKEGIVRKEWLPWVEKGIQSSFAEGENGLLDDEIVSEKEKFIDVIYLSRFYALEQGIADDLQEISRAIPSAINELPATFLKLDAELSDEQKSAIKTSVQHPLSILTGGPGTGKTTALRALIMNLESANKRYVLSSPTGRAAKRLGQATNRNASTVHRMLGYSPGEGFLHNRKNPLKVDLVVVDEASMLDTYLTYRLLQAISPGTHLLLVGDVDQLPSVGAGDILRDIISSGIAPVTRLRKIFRQAAHSHIITNSHRINRGEMPKFVSSENSDEGDFFLFTSDSPDEAAEWVQDIVCNRIPKKFHLHPRDDIQVLAPMYRGPIGVTALNDRIQSILNPTNNSKPEKKLFGQVFRVGDKVMQIHNNYDKDVFNGDIGFIIEINLVEQTLGIDFEGRMVYYDWSEADQLVLAYAISVHKAQGSEFPAVVLPVMTQHYMMLQRNLLYTAVTRAKKLCVIVGNTRAISIAVKNDKVSHRYTALDWRLRSSG